MIYMRGQARDYDNWAKLTGDDAWNWDQSLRDFMAHEDHYKLDGGADPATGDNSRFSDLHGSGGEWRIEKQRLRWDVLDSFADAAVQNGISKTDDFNSGDNAGVGYFDVNQRSGWRWNTSKAFLRPAKSRPNLTIWTQAQVEKLTLARGDDGALRCTGARVNRDGQTVTASANKEVILSAGAINSPQILQLSGIGPAATLRAHGIDVAKDAPVGLNLQDHLQIRAVYKVAGTKTLNKLAAKSVWQSQNRRGIPVQTLWPHEHVTQPAGCFHPALTPAAPMPTLNTTSNPSASRRLAIRCMTSPRSPSASAT